MINFRLLKLSDPWLWISTSLLIVIGMFVIFSCTYSMQLKLGADAFVFVKRQSVSLLIGTLAMLVFVYIDYKRLKKAFQEA